MANFVLKASIGHGYNIHVVIFKNDKTNETSVCLRLPESPEIDLV